MDNPILYQGLGGLMIVFFLVLIYFFTKTWRWFHIVSVVLVFGVSIFFVRNAAAVYRTWNAWRSEVTRSTAQLEKVADENRVLRYGKPDDTQQAVESMRLLTSKIGRMILDRGRVWRGCQPQPPQPDGTVTVTTAVAAADPAAAPPVAPPDPAVVAPAGGAAAAPPAAAPAARPAAPPPAPIPDQTVLYVFLEDVPPPEAGVPPGRKVPYYYLGDFVATASTGTSVTLRPLTPLGAFDRAVLTRPNSTWSLYETLPVDGHEWFSTDPDEKPNWNRPANEEPVFGKIQEDSLKAMLTWQRFLPQSFASPAEFQQATDRVNAGVESYLRDGKGVANKDEFPPMLVWSKVRFLKSHKEVVDSGANVSPFAPGLTDDFFNRGMAEVAILQQGKEAEFKQDDVGVFPQEDAQRLIDTGVCKFEEHIYARQLNDYAFLFRNFLQRFDRVNDDIDKIQRDIAELQLAQANINTQIALANDEKSKLESDLNQTQSEATKIAAYAAVIEKTWADTKAMLSQMYRVNHELETALEQRSQELTDEINRRTLQAVAEK